MKSDQVPLVDDEYSELVSRARDALKANPENQHARTVLENFASYMKTGERVESFSEFML